MTERHALTTDVGLTTYPDWPTLIERAVNDVSRLSQALIWRLYSNFPTN